MVTARLDSTGFFENVYPGADSPASGIVALLATAHTLKKVEDKVMTTVDTLPYAVQLYTF